MKKIPTLRSVMTPLPHAVDAGAPLRFARQMMLEHGVRDLPVKRGQKHVGVLTDRDLKRALASPVPDAGDREDAMLRGLSDAVHASRVQHQSEEAGMLLSREDSEFVVPLAAAAAMLGDGIFAPYLNILTGHEDDPEVRRRFRAWLARTLLDQVGRS